MRIIALAVLLCVTGVIEAAQMPLSVLPGGAVVYKPIQSIRERKFVDLVQQKPTSVVAQPHWPPFCARLIGWT